jgi:choline monooxygenase
VNDSLQQIINSYDPDAPLSQASTIPSSWYTDEDLFAVESQTVFGNSWQFAARSDQLNNPGNFVTTEIAGEPIVIVRGDDGKLRAFFNVCRHHAAAVLTEPEGCAPQLRCPYHGWTYSLAGELKGTPDFNDVLNFDRADNGLVPVEMAVWENWIFVRLNGEQNNSGRDLTVAESELGKQIESLDLGSLLWFDRRRYELKCNWKVFVDNYLDGGYHVPHLHKGLDSVLDYRNYTIENGADTVCNRVRWSRPAKVKLAPCGRVHALCITGSIPTS